MRAIFLALLSSLAFVAALSGQGSPVSAADAATQARVDVVNLLIANESADDFFAQGLAARDSEQIGPALIAFLVAYRMDAERYDAAFEIARLFTAWEEQELGWTWLGRALDGGYWSEHKLTQDRVLEPLRTRAGFDGLVTRARANFQEALPGLRGLTVVRRPEGVAPTGGWPTLLCLHGYGTDQRDLTSLAEVGASQGFFAISVCGYDPISPRSYAWPNQGAAIQTYLEGVLTTFKEEPACDVDSVYTTGFSQGGLVATYLVATNPERFRGALPISPAGPLAVPAPRQGAPARPLYMLYGSAEGAGVHANVRRFRREFEAAGGRVQIETHSGGHSFPDNWSEVLTRGLEFLRSQDD